MNEAALDAATRAAYVASWISNRGSSYTPSQMYPGEVEHFRKVARAAITTYLEADMRPIPIDTTLTTQETVAACDVPTKGPVKDDE